MREWLCPTQLMMRMTRKIVVQVSRAGIGCKLCRRRCGSFHLPASPAIPSRKSAHTSGGRRVTPRSRGRALYCRRPNPAWRACKAAAKQADDYVLSRQFRYPAHALETNLCTPPCVKTGAYSNTYFKYPMSCARAEIRPSRSPDPKRL